MTAFTIFALAMVAMRVMFVERGTLGTVEVERTLNAKQHGLPEWSLADGVIFSLGCNWECVFLGSLDDTTRSRRPSLVQRL